MVASEAVNQLREDKLASVIYKRNLKSYRINWNARSGLSLETHDQYIREFVNDFYKSVIRLADRGAKKFDCSELGVLKLELQGSLLQQFVINHQIAPFIQSATLVTNKRVCCYLGQSGDNLSSRH